MELPAHTRQRIDEIRALHQPVRIRLTRRGRFAWIRNLFARDACLLCRQPYPCRQREWADDVEAGRIAPAGFRSTP